MNIIIICLKNRNCYDYYYKNIILIITLITIQIFEKQIKLLYYLHS